MVSESVRRSFVEWVAGGALVAAIGAGMWAGKIQADSDHHVNQGEFARVEQKVEDLADDTQEIKDDIKELERGQREMLQLLRRSLSDDNS